MPDRYEGPATLVTEHGADIELAVTLHTTDTMGTYSWDGRGTTHNLAAVRLTGHGATLVMPDGRTGPVHIPHTEITPDTPGVLVRIHGAGPAPY